MDGVAGPLADRRVRAWRPLAVAAAVVLGLSACSDDPPDARDRVAATRTRLHAHVAAFARPATAADRPPRDLLAAAEDLCGARALNGPPSRRVARTVGRRHFDVWLVPMTDGRVALVYGTHARTCGSVQAVLDTAVRQSVPISAP